MYLVILKIQGGKMVFLFWRHLRLEFFIHTDAEKKNVRHGSFNPINNGILY